MKYWAPDRHITDSLHWGAEREDFRGNELWRGGVEQL